MKWKALVVLAVAQLFAVSIAAAATQYTSRVLSGLDSAKDINRSGIVVGSSGGHAAQWQDGTVTTLADLGGSYSVATAINDKGQVAGWSQTSDGRTHGVLWDSGNVTDLGAITPAGINESGQIVGTSSSYGYSAAIWHGGTLADLGSFGPGNSWTATSINDAGEIAGYAYIEAYFKSLAVMQQDGNFTSLSDISQADTYAYGISNGGQIVGTQRFLTPDFRMRAFSWQAGQFTLLSTPNGWWSEAYGVNCSGQIVGYSAVSQSQEDHATLWQDGQAVDIGAGFTYSRAYAINDNGWIVGNGNSQAILWQPVPEPSSPLALGSSILMFVGLAARRRSMKR